MEQPVDSLVLEQIEARKVLLAAKSLFTMICDSQSAGGRHKHRSNLLIARMRAENVIHQIEKWMEAIQTDQKEHENAE